VLKENEAGFVSVGRASEIAEGKSRLVNLDGEEIALWHVEGKFYAVRNVCPHQHYSRLHEGTLDGIFLTCPMHGWTFCLEDGRPRIGEGRAKVYKVIVKEGEVFVEKPVSK
jgi:nitrite reductase/ring-hydroxylating ferredoxin subunit